MIVVFFNPNEQRAGGGGRGAATLFLFLDYPVQQTTSGIGHSVSSFVQVGNKCAECEKQQQQQQQQHKREHYTLLPLANKVLEATGQLVSSNPPFFLWQTANTKNNYKNAETS